MHAGVCGVNDDLFVWRACMLCLEGGLMALRTDGRTGDGRGTDLGSQTRTGPPFGTCGEPPPSLLPPPPRQFAVVVWFGGVVVVHGWQ